MEILVIMRMVPDLVYKLEIDETGKSLNKTELRYIPSDLDDSAIEQALILKERYQGKITLFTFDVPNIDKQLYVFLAKGVDRVIKLTKREGMIDTEALAKAFSIKLNNHPFDILLLGVSAIDELDGEFGSYLASYLELPYIGVATGVSINNSLKNALVKKAFTGGLEGEFELQLPAIVGMQSSEKPPRYVNLMKVRKAKKASTIEEDSLPEVELESRLEIIEMIPPPIKSKAKLIAGTEEEIAVKICDVLENEGII